MFSEGSDFNLTSSLNLSSLERDWSDSALGRLSRSGHRVVSVFLGSIMVFGFLNNLLVLVLFCRFKTLRTPVNMLLLNISVSDMLVCVCGTTLSFASSLRTRWLYGRLGCMWYGFVNSCFGIVSLISLAALSYDRYSTLMVYNKQVSDYRKPLLAVGGAWLYSLLWTVPPLLGWSSYGPEGAGTSCSVTWTERSFGSHSYIICLFVFCLGLPVLVMVYCYGRLLYAVKQVGRIRHTAARRRDFHILFMVITTVVCYLVCWMPYGVVAMMATFGRPGIISPVASVVPSLLAKSSTVINPVIYILMNKQFYRCFLILFHCKHQTSENVQSSMPSRTTVVQLNRRVCDSSPAATGLAVLTGPGTIHTDGTPCPTEPTPLSHLNPPYPESSS
ncbi:teleost multiple tissue opsin 2a [Micropterus dolomieu]|uniref:teleost multiple tissue opsin 2a n=1 Tax=Micropterus dolomieu TaxID=147949 RepID=UPI001E8D0546|nr:teleost multiple tissue opsin 2a [Micropterus dolomieu]